jgi:type IV secretion system protein VirB3
MDVQNGIVPDKVAVGLTRPSTKWGVPFPAFVLNVVVSLQALIWTSDLTWLLLCVPVHGIFWLITLNDPRAFELLLLWIQTTLANLVRTYWFWSASTYSPLPVRAHFGHYERWRLQRRLKQENRS